MTTMPIARLVLDESVYPRHHVLSSNTNSIVEAIQTGEQMPPVLVDQKTRIVIDGWHRIAAYERLFGPTHEIQVKERSYNNKADMLLDAIALNTARGADLSRWDIARCVILAEEQGVALDSLAKIVHWRPDKLRQYAENRITPTINKKKIVLKRSIQHMIGQQLTPSQERANDRLDGMNPRFHAEQLILLIEENLLPMDQEELWQRLGYLANLINTHQPVELPA